MILLDLVCSQKLDSHCVWLSWHSSCEELLNCIKAFIFTASILGLWQLFVSKGLRHLGIILYQNFILFLHWALALSVACSCKVNRLNLSSSYVEWCFGVLICATQLRGTNLQAFWTAVPHLVQVWNKADLTRPFKRSLCKKPRTGGLSVTACGNAAASFSSKLGGLFLVVCYPYFQ